MVSLRTAKYARMKRSANAAQRRKERRLIEPHPKPGEKRIKLETKTIMPDGNTVSITGATTNFLPGKKADAKFAAPIIQDLVSIASILTIRTLLGLSAGFYVSIAIEA